MSTASHRNHSFACRCRWQVQTHHGSDQGSVTVNSFSSFFLTFRTADPAYISALENQMAEKEAEHKRTVELIKAHEVELTNKVEDLVAQLEHNSQELEKQTRYQLEYRKLLN